MHIRTWLTTATILVAEGQTSLLMNLKSHRLNSLWSRQLVKCQIYTRS